MSESLPTSEEFFGSATLPTSEEFFGAKSEPDESSVGGFLSGITDYIGSTLAHSPKWGMQRAVDATRDAWRRLTPQQQASVKDYAPAAGITGLSTLVPGGWAVQAATNLTANSLIHGEEAYRKGGSVLSAMNPLSHPLETLLGVAVPGVIEGASSLARGLRRLPENSPALPTAPRPDPADLEAALRLDAPLRPLPDIPILPEADEAAEAAASAAADDIPLTPYDDLAGGATSARGKIGAMVDRVREERKALSESLAMLRSGISRPARYLSRAEGEGARVAGYRLEDLTHTEQRLRENAMKMLHGIFGDMDLAGREQVTRILDGSDSVSPRADVMEAATKMRDFYDQWANLSEREGLLTKELIDDEMLGDGGFTYRPFQRIPENYSPLIAEEDSISRPLRDKLRGIFRKDTVAHARRPGDVESEVKYLTDALEIAKTYTDDYAKKIAIARTFGSDIGAPLAGKPWGQKANDLLKVIDSENDPVAREMFKATMDRLYSGQSEPWAQALSDINAKLTSSMLGGSWATQLGQSASPIWRYGLGNTIEGLTRYYREPAFRALIDASGVRDAGYANFIAGHADDLASAPIRAIGKVESFLRGPMNSGVVPYLEKIADDMQAVPERWRLGSVDSAVAKQLEELMLRPEQVANGLDYNTLKDAIQASGRRSQFHAGTIGQTGNAFLTPGMKQMFSLQPFGWSAWTAVQDDVLEPLLSRDKNLRMLGLGRLGRMIPASLAAESLRELIASGVRVREPDSREILANALGTQFGAPGQLLGGQVLNQAVDPRFNMIPPMIGVPVGIGNDIWKGNFGRAAVNAGAVLDPTGYTALARPTLLGLLSQMKSDEKRKRKK